MSEEADAGCQAFAARLERMGYVERTYWIPKEAEQTLERVVDMLRCGDYDKAEKILRAVADAIRMGLPVDVNGASRYHGATPAKPPCWRV